MNSPDRATAAHPHKHVDHVWVKPPPGSGTLPVCERCGIKKKADTMNSACDGMQNEAFKPTQHDYDPY